MSTVTVTVAGMTCGHCASSVREEVGHVAGVHGVDVDLASGTVSIDSDRPIDPMQSSARSKRRATSWPAKRPCHDICY